MTSDPSIARQGAGATARRAGGLRLGGSALWRTSVRVLAEPLSDSADRWLEFEGTSVVRPLMDGRANVVELRVSRAAGEIAGLNLRLYEPATQRWSATFASLRDGQLTPSVSGGFHDGVGELHGDDHLGGRPIRVRFVIERDGGGPGDLHPGVLRRRGHDLADQLGGRRRTRTHRRRRVGQPFCSSSASITMMPLGPRT